MAMIGSSSKTINASLKNKQSLLQNSQITNDLVVSNGANLVNSLVNKIVKDDSLYISTLTSARNLIQLSNVNCAGNINISDVDQVNRITSTMKTEMKTSVVNNIQQKIETTIKNTIENQKPPQKYVEAILNKNKEGLDAFLENGQKTIKTFGDQVAKAGASMGSPPFSLGKSDQTVNVNADIETNVSQTLGISTSAASTAVNNVSNTTELSTALKNFMQAINDISASNIIRAENIQCGGSINLNNINQLNEIKTEFSTSFNSSVLNNISIKISTNIMNAYKSLYDEIGKTTITESFSEDGTPSPQEKAILARLDVAEVMHLSTLYALCQDDSADSIKLKCIINKRLRDLAGSLAPPMDPICIDVNIDDPFALVQVSDVPYSSPTGPPNNLSSGSPNDSSSGSPNDSSKTNLVNQSILSKLLSPLYLSGLILILIVIIVIVISLFVVK